MRIHGPIEEPAAAKTVGRSKRLESSPAVQTNQPLALLLEQDRADSAE